MCKLGDVQNVPCDTHMHWTDFQRHDSSMLPRSPDHAAQPYSCVPDKNAKLHHELGHARGRGLEARLDDRGLLQAGDLQPLPFVLREVLAFVKDPLWITNFRGRLYRINQIGDLL